MMKWATVTAGLLCTSTWAATTAAPVKNNEIVVKFKEGKARSFLQQSNLKSFGILAVKKQMNLDFGTYAVLKARDEKSLTQSVQMLSNDPNIEYAEPNYIYSIDPLRGEKFTGKKVMPTSDLDISATAPNDPRFKDLWGLRNTGANEPNGRAAGVEGADVNALKAWDITKGSRAIKIAVIDTGIDYRHADLQRNMWVNQAELNGKAGVDDDKNGYTDDVYGYDFANNDADPMDGHGHGTHCAGTIGAVHNNGVGVAGVMDEVTLVPIKFLDDSGSGSLDAAIQSIDYATKLNVDLMSNSWGGGGRSEALNDAIKRAADQGIIFTAAAGNSSSNNDQVESYPANYDQPNVISVAALTAQNGLASFSSYGRNKVHIAAPGHNVLSTVQGGNYEVMSGTSMATPHVSGVIGLLLAKEGRLNLEDVRERVVMTGISAAGLRGKTQTSSRIDAYNLLTDTRPVRNEPNPKNWQKVALSDVWESAHPYADNFSETKSFSVPGAKYMRLKVKKVDLENGYDYLKIEDKNGAVVQKLSGAGTDVASDYLEGDAMNVTFVSDRSVSKWGFLIEEVEVQY